MSKVLHLLRHGEVENPNGVIYGRLPGFALTAHGHAQAAAAAEYLATRPIEALFVSPLLRAQQSATPVARTLELEIQTAPEIIEAAHHLEGKRLGSTTALLATPRLWPYLRNPLRPSWGEAYSSIAERMSSFIQAAFTTADEILLLSHQAPIVITTRHLQGKPLLHNPAARRCAHSSVTTLHLNADGVVTRLEYWQPDPKTT